MQSYANYRINANLCTFFCFFVCYFVLFFVTLYARKKIGLYMDNVFECLIAIAERTNAAKTSCSFERDGYCITIKAERKE